MSIDENAICEAVDRVSAQAARGNTYAKNPGVYTHPGVVTGGAYCTYLCDNLAGELVRVQALLVSDRDAVMHQLAAHFVAQLDG